MSSEGKSEKRPGGLIDMVFDELSSRIHGGEYPPEARLPSEHQLADTFSVSRPVVRSALARLRTAGVIYSRRGAGTFVRSPDPQETESSYIPIKNVVDLQRCYEFRLSIEPSAAAKCAQRRDADVLRQIEDTIEEMREAARNPGLRADSNFVFHRTIAVGANNAYFLSSIEALKPHITAGMYIHGLAKGPKQEIERVLAEHETIYEAIRNGNQAAAEAAMRRHLELSRDRLFGGASFDLSMSDQSVSAMPG